MGVLNTGNQIECGAYFIEKAKVKKTWKCLVDKDQLHTLHMLSRVSVGHVRNTLEKYNWEIQLRNTLERNTSIKYTSTVQQQDPLQRLQMLPHVPFGHVGELKSYWEGHRTPPWMQPFYSLSSKQYEVKPHQPQKDASKGTKELSFQSWCHPRMCHPSVIQGSNRIPFFYVTQGFPGLT